MTRTFLSLAYLRHLSTASIASKQTTSCSGQSWSQHCPKPRIKPPKIPSTRVMVGALDPLLGCCSNLTSLRITTVGEYEPRFPGELENDLYRSWARFLNSARSTLNSFYFEQGYNRCNYGCTKGYCCPRPTTNERMMDRLFVQWILPVLLEAP
jgi:hypothetical protein